MSPSYITYTDFKRLNIIYYFKEKLYLVVQRVSEELKNIWSISRINSILIFKNLNGRFICFNILFVFMDNTKGAMWDYSEEFSYPCVFQCFKKNIR